MARAGVGLLVVVLIAGTLGITWPALREKREYPAAIPQPSPLFFTALVPVRPGQSACFADAVMDERSEEARFQVGTRLRPGIPLELTIRGRGYAHRARVERYRDNDLIRVPVPRPASSIPVRVCIENAGRHRFDLYAAADRTRSRSLTRVDGTTADSAVVFSFWERTPRSMWERLPATFDRIATFRPGFVEPWLLWGLAVLFGVGVPVAVAAAFARSLRDS